MLLNAFKKQCKCSIVAACMLRDIQIAERKGIELNKVPSIFWYAQILLDTSNPFKRR